MNQDVETFRALHVPGQPLVLYNIWDAGSAKAVEAAGAPALATGSYGVAEALGTGDGEKLPLAEVIANLERIVAAVKVPVSLDLESGYGADPAAVCASVQAVRDAGAVGINMEDRLPGEERPLPLVEAAERVAAAAASGLFVNARTDLFRQTVIGDALIDDAVARAHAYAEAGAAGLFVPFLADREAVRTICAASPLPVNVTAKPELGTVAEIAALGVARISYGHQPWLWAMQKLTADAEAIYRA
ncbi:MAG: isocitrate lyase/phosphoenolpyruvate mutase family protein [Altererythrobacter sp.]|nr:isocitrate lyase/phosphoenolpyruvate mutase family protein [Altererythrobacter sp.]